MKKFLVLIVCLLALALPVAAQDWPGVYPEEFVGSQLAAGEVDPVRLVWLAADFVPYSFGVELPYWVLGFEGRIVAPRRGVIRVEFDGLYTLGGVRVSPGIYPGGGWFAWSDACGCYLDAPVEAPFTAWTLTPDGWRWRTGCFEFTGSPFPWYDVSDACEYDTWGEVAPAARRPMLE